MRCPYCGHDNDRVIDSRACDEGGSIRRRRECGYCDRRYTTYERVGDAGVRVIKKDGARTPFDREKLRAGIVKACTKRPILDEKLIEIVDAIEKQVLDRPDQLIESSELGEMVLEHLRGLDEVAYLRFASVYREFRTADDFVQEADQANNPARRAR